MSLDKKLMTYVDQNMYFTHSRPEMLPFVSTQAKRILEIGCGAGTFAKNVKARQTCEYWGVEPSALAGRVGTNLDKLVPATFDDAFAALPKKYFDSIVLNDVLEHTIDPFETLSKIRSLLSDSGEVVASIPNILFIKNLFHLLILKDWKYEDSGIRDRTHLRFFTKKSILFMFHECKYHVVKIEGILPTHQKVLFFIFNIFTFFRLKEARYTNFAIKAYVASQNNELNTMAKLGNNI